MKFEMLVNVVVRDKNGKVLKRLKRKCSSYVLAMIDTLNVQMGQVNRSIKDTSGVVQTVIRNSTAFAVNSGAGTTSHGIVVGTGTTTVVITDYQLATLIAHGTGSGQLSYGATSVGTPATVGSSRQFTVARTMTNNSGASITVEEVGLYIRVGIDTVTYAYLMAERSLLSFSIANGASATVTYTIKVTV